jgi:hypothetical protein
MKKYFLLILMFNQAFATLYKPVSISEQVKSSDAVVIGYIDNKNSELLSDGQVVTKVTLRLERWMGIDNEESNRIFSILIPGGKIGHTVSKIPDNIEFEVGEKVLLFLKQHKGFYWPTNLGLSKYSIKSVGEGELLVNQIFPKHPQIGQIPINYVLGKVSKIKKQDFIVAYKDKYEIQEVKERASRAGRKIASVDSPDKRESHMNLLWLILILGIAGGLTKSYRKQEE